MFSYIELVMFPISIIKIPIININLFEISILNLTMDIHGQYFYGTSNGKKVKKTCGMLFNFAH
jgi:hypothetical protein